MIKKYRILEIYVFAAWKPVFTSRGGLHATGTAVKRFVHSKGHAAMQAVTPRARALRLPLASYSSW